MKKPMRKCKHCGLEALNEEDLELFTKEKNSKFGRTNCCIECRKEQYYTYNEMLVQQDGVCKICKQKEKHDKLLAVDHDHSTGEVRGLLCNKCNKGIGFFSDSEILLRNAIKYLNKEL